MVKAMRADRVTLLYLQEMAEHFQRGKHRDEDRIIGPSLDAIERSYDVLLQLSDRDSAKFLDWKITFARSIPNTICCFCLKLAGSLHTESFEDSEPLAKLLPRFNPPACATSRTLNICAFERMFVLFPHTLSH
jgi:hypothetical protein